MDYWELILDQIKYIDTAGLKDNRGNLIRVIVMYQLVELLRSNKLQSLILTLRMHDIQKSNMANNNVREFIDFFSQFYDVKKLNNGFYDGLVNKHFDQQYHEQINTISQIQR